ncbi:hypothetical protein Q0Z83_034590 [Actinoplanes sichuanensis]|uniref:Lipoprotein n=1 Tax=Actinoplanes sichuanensis TaxID=512349 RepID=A0ABW4AUK3_9ACTN|nr:hypothetical protein [Actinoplanes sichuanensis]BEL05268.1 hypothetical protein Q0Z83_034590 [Actinoplanes sichuanensis]
MRPVPALLAGLLLLTACSGEFVESKSEADTTALVQQHADALAGVVGEPLRDPATGPMPCSGTRDGYAVQGAYNIDVPDGEEPRATLGRVRSDWTAKGYEITDDREIGAYEGVLAAKTEDGFSLDIETVSRDAFAVLLHSPCFARPS